MTQSVRLFWRTARFEILAGLGISLALTLAMLATANQLDTIRASACAGLRTCDDVAFTNVLITFSEPLRFGASLVPLVIGLLYGPALVAHELEARSAPFAWALVRSRIRWLAWRTWPATLLVALLLVGPALAGDRLEAASFPQFDPAQSFYDVGARGELLVLRGLAAFALGLAAGVVLGRTLPAILLAAALCILGLGLAANVRPLWLPREAIALDEMNQATTAVPLFLSGGVVLPDGRILTDAESVAIRPPEAQDITSPGYALWLFHSGAHRAFIGVSGVHLREVEGREGVATGAVGLTGFLVSILAIRRRRPSPGFALEVDARRDVAVPAGRAPPRDRARWRRSGPWLSWLMTIRVGRPELVGAVVAAVTVVAVTVIATKLMADARVAEHCVNTACAPGPGTFNSLYNSVADGFDPLLASVPFVVGGLLGAPLVARELETGTGRLTWSLTSSRIRWLLWRVLPPLALTVVLLGAVAMAANAMSYQQTLIDPAFYFGDGHLRGTRLVARGVAAFAIAVLAGVAVRRVLPALIVAAIGGVILYNALDWAMPHWMPFDVIGDPNEVGNAAAITPGSYLWSDSLEAPDGSFHLAYEVALANGFPRRTPAGDIIEMDQGFIDWYTARGYREVNAGWDASRYPEIVFRESAVLLGGAVVVLVLAAGSLERRRPG